MGALSTDDWLTVGKITGCYGVKGWVKVHAFTEPQENFLQFEKWVIRRRGGLEALVFDAGKRQGKGLVAHIEGVDDRNSAEAFHGLEVAVPAGSLPALNEDEFYWHQLQGLAVWCHNVSEPGSQAVLLGEVDHLIETGANDVLVVRPSEGSIDQRERLIPYLDGEVVKKVDLAGGRLDVDWYPDE